MGFESQRDHKDLKNGHFKQKRRMNMRLFCLKCNLALKNTNKHPGNQLVPLKSAFIRSSKNQFEI